MRPKSLMNLLVAVSMYTGLRVVYICPEIEDGRRLSDGFVEGGDGLRTALVSVVSFEGLATESTIESAATSSPPATPSQGSSRGTRRGGSYLPTCHPKGDA